MVSTTANINMHDAFVYFYLYTLAVCEIMTEMNKYNNVVIYDYKITLYS